MLYSGYYVLAILVICMYFAWTHIFDDMLIGSTSYKPKRRKLFVPYERRFFNTYQVDKKAFYDTDISYQQYKIPKRSGGHRTLLVPNPDLKMLQQQLLQGFNAHLRKRVHKSAHPYVKGRSIKTNALQHAGNKVLIKLDIEKFFDSVNNTHLEPYLRSISWAPKIQDRLIELMITDRGLPQGAPTSPFVANIILYKFDVALLAYCVRRNYKYTRYADDITVSLPEDDSKAIGRVIKFVEESLQNNGFRLNKKPQKLNVLRPHQAQRVCGVTINSGKPTISRKQRRMLRSARHYQSIGRKPSLSEQQLQGHEAFVDMIM